MMKSPFDIRRFPAVFRVIAALLVWPPGGVAPGPAAAGAANPPQPVLVELFTSEGCSSCPPADRLLMELDRRQPVPGADIIVLSEHVDYWNSVGWRDPYSSHQWSERQSEYAGRFGLDSVYTPQIVVDGELQVTGGDGRAVRRAINQSLLQPAISIGISGVQVNPGAIQLWFTAAAASHAMLYAALADEADRSSVQRGENAGRILDHVAVLRSLQLIATLKGAPLSKTVSLDLPRDIASRSFRLILFAQDQTSGHIVGAVQRKL